MPQKLLAPKGEISMARCEQGYLCEVCGQEVEDLTDSDLYLRYVLGEVAPERLHLLPERHIRCNPVLAQFIATEGWLPVVVEGAFSRSALDREFVDHEESRVTRGYHRLRELVRLGLPIEDYPLALTAGDTDHPDGQGGASSPHA